MDNFEIYDIEQINTIDQTFILGGGSGQRVEKDLI
jgi:hypothetical protein